MAPAPRQLSIATPLGPGALTLAGFSGREAVSQLFSFELDLVGPSSDTVPFEQLVGQPVTVGLGNGRFFNGLVSRFSAGARTTHDASYRSELVPRLWLLTLSRGSRIFQNVSVPDIVARVLAEGGVDASFELGGSYLPRNYCVQ